MKPLYDAWLIQIEVTNACFLKCSHCTRAVPHIKDPYYVDLAFLEKALSSLKGWPKGVGCMGGEPTMHPQFAEICKLYQKYFPRHQCGLWTSGGRYYKQYEKLIQETFGTLLYNDHSEVGKHQPLMLASEEIIPDDKLREELIDQCWIQHRWSPAITPKGGFFCEVAATFDLLFDGPGGYPLEPGWWNRDDKAFRDQRDRYCRLCSIPIPMEAIANNLPYDYISKGNVERLKKSGSPLVAKGGVQIVEVQYSRQDIENLKDQKLDPWNYLGPQGVRKKGVDPRKFQEQIIDWCFTHDATKNTQLPGIVVVMPAYNAAKTIHRALTSIDEAIRYFRESHPQGHEVLIEAVVVNDASRDNTEEILRHFAKNRPYFRIISHPYNAGAGAARNTGIRFSQGNIITFCDADDRLFRDHLAVCYDAMTVHLKRPEKQPAGVFRTQILINESIYPDWVPIINNTLPTGFCVRRQAHEFIGGFPEDAVYRQIKGREDAAYSRFMKRFMHWVEVKQKTAEHVRYPGNSLDRQYEKFQKPYADWKSFGSHEAHLHTIAKQLEDNISAHIELKVRTLDHRYVPGTMLSSPWREQFARYQGTSGNKWVGQGNHQEALACYEAAVEAKPDLSSEELAVFYYNMGTIQLELKQEREALSSFEKCQLYNSHLTQAHEMVKRLRQKLHTTSL